MRVSVYDPLPTRSGEPAAERRFEIRPTPAGIHQLELSGSLGAQFAAPLCRGLARAGLDVRRGFARRTGPGSWIVRFDLVRRAGSSDPIGIDYLELTKLGRRSGLADRAEVSDWSLTESDLHGGSLCLEVVARDRTGFLGGLLERIAALDLVAAEMRIWTDDDGVTDRFYLQTRTGTPPPKEAWASLEALLGDPSKS